MLSADGTFIGFWPQDKNFRVQIAKIRVKFRVITFAFRVGTQKGEQGGVGFFNACGSV